MPQVAAPLEFNASPQIEDAFEPIKNSADEEKELKVLLALLAKGRKSRSKYDESWNKYDAYYDGRQWYGKARPKYRSAPVANVIRPSIQTIIPIITDTQPGIDVVPSEPTDFQFSNILSKVISSWWRRTSMSVTMVNVLTDCMKLDVGVIKCVWDQDAADGGGDVSCVVIDPRNIFVPEEAQDFNKNCPWTIELYPATVGELKRKYPEKAELIKATGKRREQDDRADVTEVKVVSPVDKDEYTESSEDMGLYDEGECVWCAEMWIDDYAVEEINEEYTDDNGEQQTRTITKRKYPQGKVVQAIPAQKVILAVGPNPYKDGLKPYVRFVDVVRPRQFYGEGEVGPYIETQDLINRTLAVIYDYTTLMTNPTWVVDMESGVDPDMLTNQVGLVIPKKHGTECRREAPPPMPGQVFEFYNMMRELFDTQSGVHDITQGRKPVGVTAAEAINTMQEAAQTRIRLKERNMQVSLEQLGQLIVSRILQFYTRPRVIKISGDSQWPEFFEFFVNENENGNYTYQTRQYNYSEGEERYIPEQQYKTGESKGLFDVEVIAGTALPFMKAQRGELAIRLHREGLIDQQSALDTLEWPNKEVMMKRMQEQAQQAAMAQAGGPPMPPPGR